MAKSIFMKWIMQAYMMPSLNIYLKPNDLMHSFGALRVVIHDPRHTECSNLTEAIWTQYICWYIYIYIYIYYIHTYYFISHIYIYTYTWELQARPHRRRGCHPHTYFSRTFPVKIRFCVILQGTQLAPALPESRRWA